MVKSKIEKMKGRLVVMYTNSKKTQTSKFNLECFSVWQCLKKSYFHVHLKLKKRFDAINAFKFEAYDFQSIVLDVLFVQF